MYPKLDLRSHPEVSWAKRYLSQENGWSANLGAGTSGLTVCIAMQLSGQPSAIKRHILKPLANVSIGRNLRSVRGGG